MLSTISEYYFRYQWRPATKYSNTRRSTISRTIHQKVSQHTWIPGGSNSYSPRSQDWARENETKYRFSRAWDTCNRVRPLVAQALMRRKFETYAVCSHRRTKVYENICHQTWSGLEVGEEWLYSSARVIVALLKSYIPETIFEEDEPEVKRFQTNRQSQYTCNREYTVASRRVLSTWAPWPVFPHHEKRPGGI